jgi:uncharacterized protein (PEP-CTERM system associated)
MAAMGTTAMDKISYRKAPMPRALIPIVLFVTGTLGISGGDIYAQSLHILPRLSVTQSYTDNVQQSSNEMARQDWVIEASPGIRMERLGSRTSFLIDFQLRNFAYANESRLNNSQKQLTSFLKVEAIEKWLFIDSQANISQQNRSPFAGSVLTGPSVVGGAGNNRVETTTYQISPYVRGLFSNVATYQVRYNATETHTNENAFPTTHLYDLTGKFANASSSAKLGWSVDATALSVKNNIIGSRVDQRLRGALIYAIEPQLRLSVIGGYEKTDYASIDKRGTDIYGAGIEWSPSPRTQFAAVREHRFFGDGHSVLFSHRTPMTAWRFTSSNDVSILPAQLTALDPGSVYSSLSDLLQSSIPDPTERAQAVQARLAQTGIPPGYSVGSSFLTTRPFVNRNRELSVALIGVRNTVTFSYGNRNQRGVGLGLSSALGNLNEDVRRELVNAAWAHRLTPLSTLTVLASRVRSESLGLDRTQSTQYAQSVTWSRPISPKATLSAGLQHSDLDSVAGNSYKENTVFANLTYRFY